MKKRYFVVALLLFGLLLVGCNSDDKDQSAAIAEVNGEQITHKEYDEHVKLLRTTYEMQYLGAGKLDDAEDKDIIAQLAEQSYQEMVFQKLICQDAEKQGIEVEASELDEALESIDLESFLEMSGMEEKYFRQEMETQLVYWELREEVTDGVTVSEEEAQKYYQDNLANYTEEGGMEIAHILVDEEEEALALLDKINAGEDFAELAKENSTCPSKEQGGELGVINDDSAYVTEFKEAALKLQPGAITASPVKSEFGYHIIKAGEMIESNTHPFEEVKGSVMTDLENQKKDTAYNEYLDELNGKAEIKDLRSE